VLVPRQRASHGGENRISDTFRRADPTDAAQCGRICYEAFGSIHDAHNFPRDFPSPEVSAGLLGMLIGHPGFYDVVVERDGKIIGSNSWMNDRPSLELDRSLSIGLYRIEVSDVLRPFDI
jgi:hypothetical protein